MGRKWKEQSVVRGQRCEAPDYGFFSHPFRWRAIINGKFGEATIVRREDGGGRQKNGRREKQRGETESGREEENGGNDSIVRNSRRDQLETR